MSHPRITGDAPHSSRLARLVRCAAARGTISTFVVPGPEFLEIYRLDRAQAGLRLVASPLHAQLLLILGAIPAGLAHAARLVYEQMPPPRTVALLGVAPNDDLPGADVVSTLDAEGLSHAAETCRRALVNAVWPPCMNAGHAPMDAPAAAPQPTGMEQMADMHDGMSANDEAGEGHPSAHAGMDMSSMDMGGMSMSMSMAAMTRDLEASQDGLRMEWFEAPYGPLFPSLPAGLRLHLRLDGDTVARASADVDSVRRRLAATWVGDLTTFADRVAALDPLTPLAYRVLARRALAAIHPRVDDELDDRATLAALERERILSHLVWLSRFGWLIGFAWLADTAASLARRVADRHAQTVMRGFVQRVSDHALLVRRLRGVATLGPEDVGNSSGPTARACGVAADARANDRAYVALGFTPVVHGDGDALARLRVRLGDIQQSLDLLARIGGPAPSPRTIEKAPSGTGEAAIETPRGSARLRVRVEEGQVLETSLSSPSAALLSLVPAACKSSEFADALLGVASLDLSPWDAAG